eukprot:jgi/Mesen1/5644/ME000286S04857
MAIFGDFGTPIAFVVAGLCTCFAVAVTIWQIYMHLSNYTEPTYQRYIVRMIFMVPVYALMSFLALVMSDKAIYFNTIRDVYEAWVIYNFLSLCLAWVGGPGAVVTSLTGRLLKPSLALMTCCLPPMPLDGRFIRRCKQGCLQFVILKPLLAATCLVLYRYGRYEDGNFSPAQGYLYITLLYTLSYSAALYALILFYVACKDLLRPFKPIPKFLIIKSVSVLVFVVGKLGVVKDEDDAADLQNLLICFEMAAAAVGFLYAFPHRPYEGANVGERRSGLSGSIQHAINFNDVVYDTMHQAPVKYRTRTFVPTGQEMDTLRKHRKMFGAGKQHDDSCSSASVSAAGSVTASPVSPSPSDALAAKASPVFGSPKPSSADGGLLSDVQILQPVAYDMSPIRPVPGGAVRSPQLGLPAVAFVGSDPSLAAFSLPGSAVPAASPNPMASPAPLAPGTVLPPLPGTRKWNTGYGAGDSRRPSGSEGFDRSGRTSSADGSRRTSTGEDSSEATRLTRGRATSHGMLMDDVDFNGDDEVNLEGHVRR